MKCKGLKDTTFKLPAYLHSHWKVILSLWWKEDIDSFLLERRISSRRSSNFYDVKFATSSSSDSKTEEGALLSVALHLKLAEGCCMTL